jgi:hypothetical protein
MAAALLAVLVALILRILWPAGAPAATGLLILAGAVLLAVFRELGRHVRRSRYRRQRWGAGDTMIALSSLAALGGILAVGRAAPAQLGYDPFSGPLLPAFGFWPGLAVALLAVPGLISLAQEGGPARDGPP